MLRYNSRILLPTALAALLTIASCGADTPKAEVSEGLSNVSVSGAFAAAPEVKWSGPVEVTKTATETPIVGDGDVIAKDTLLLAKLWVGNGTTEKQQISLFDQAAQVYPIDQLPAAIGAGVTGAKVGSRVVVAAPPKDAFGEAGNPNAGIGNKDTVIFIVDVTGTVPREPQGKEVAPASWAPKIVETEGKPSGLNFTGVAKPAGELLKTVLIEGTGRPVAKGQQIYVNYLGQVFGGKEPFDQSYTGAQPFSFEVGEVPPKVIVGWDTGLRGVKVGTRVLLQVPPAQGYGKQGQPTAGIKGTDTMYFVVDVLASVDVPAPPKPSPSPAASAPAGPDSSPTSSPSAGAGEEPSGSGTGRQ
jgi:peptidylprolyl isomerase